jgi:hypothetical protein
LVASKTLLGKKPASSQDLIDANAFDEANELLAMALPALVVVPLCIATIFKLLFVIIFLHRSSTSSSDAELVRRVLVCLRNPNLKSSN